METRQHKHKGNILRKLGIILHQHRIRSYHRQCNLHGHDFWTCKFHLKKAKVLTDVPLEPTIYFWFSLQILSETLLILRRIK
jgi:hypothetical protein